MFRNKLNMIVILNKKSEIWNRVNLVLNIELLLLTVTDVSTICAVVIFRVKVSGITPVDGIKLWLLTWLVDYWSSISEAVMLLAMKTRDVIGAIRSVYCHC